MSLYYEKLDWSISFSQHLENLISVGSPSYGSSNVNIFPPNAFNIIPELGALNKLLIEFGYKIISTTIVNTNPHIFGGIHIDKTRTNRPLELRLNIPLENSTTMFNRWYDVSETPYSDIAWDYQPKYPTQGDIWFLENSSMMVEKHCIETLVLDGPVFFRSSIPHNVDGRYSEVRRRILSIVFSNSKTNRIADWCERDIILDCIRRI